MIDEDTTAIECLEVGPEILLTSPGLLAGRQDLVSRESKAIRARVAEFNCPPKSNRSVSYTFVFILFLFFHLMSAFKMSGRWDFQLTQARQASRR